MQSAVRKWPVEASVSLSSLWTLPLRGNISLEMSKFIRALHISASYGKQNISFAAALDSVNKVLWLNSFSFKVWGSDGILIFFVLLWFCLRS